MVMVGNTRLFMAVYSLATMEGDVRKRVVVAMKDLSVLGKHEFKNVSTWKRIVKLKEQTTKYGPAMVNGKMYKDAFENTARVSMNKTYRKHAEEIFSIWHDEMTEDL